MKAKIACCQVIPGSDTEKNLNAAKEAVEEAAFNGADIVVLPEMFVCPYCHANFSRTAEPVEGFIYEELRELAKKCGVYLFAGSVPERSEKRIYNTCYAFDRKGNLIAHHRKVHLFDVAVEGGIQFRESRVLTPGNAITLAQTEFGPVGVAICYDLRFVEMFRIMALKGAKLMIVPAAFNMTTGPAHWELTLRARALDNQCYVAACSTGRDESADYRAWGHSCVVDPWGRVVSTLDEKQGTLYSVINFDFVDKIRRELPILAARRTDVYTCKEADNG
jgi:omega-amidase